MKNFFFGLIIGMTLAICLYWGIRYFTPDKSLFIQGVVRYRAPADLSVSFPDPEGYYIEVQSPFYLNQVDPQFLNKTVLVRGPLATRCGRDGNPCYPELQVKKITEIRNK